MKAAELRIGNIVNQGSYGELPITAYELYNFEKFQIGGYGADYYKEWRPIALTQKWLLMFGFINGGKTRGDSVFLIGEWEILRITDGVDEYKFSDHNLKLQMKYVHQLQNLYFALTGQELTLQHLESQSKQDKK